MRWTVVFYNAAVLAEMEALPLDMRGRLAHG
jgi:hypothetical protein